MVCSCQGCLILWHKSFTTAWLRDEKWQNTFKKFHNPSPLEEAVLEALLSKREASSKLHCGDIKVFSDSEIFKGFHMKMNDTVYKQTVRWAIGILLWRRLKTIYLCNWWKCGKRQSEKDGCGKEGHYQVNYFLARGPPFSPGCLLWRAREGRRG